MHTAMTMAMVLIWLLLVVPSAAQSPTPGIDRPLIVGTKEAPPFAMQRADGTWHGISIELWQRIATELRLRYELRAFDLPGLLEGVAQGSIDVGVAALTITAERETRMDFTHPFYTTGLTIATAPHNTWSWSQALRRFLSVQFFELIGSLLLVLLLVGSAIWLFERRRNAPQFGGGVAHGIGAGLWWAAVTMTTVGYGDKAPVTAGGRAIALVWMFAGLILVASFTAAMTAALTVSELTTQVSGPESLARLRVATVLNSTSEAYLRQQRWNYTLYPTVAEGLQAIGKGEVDAVVYDAPLLKYLANTTMRGRLELYPSTFERQDYGIALPLQSPLRKDINRTLLHQLAQPAWQDILYQYLGKSP